jgi:phytoene dehydrogenase-like protein
MSKKYDVVVIGAGHNGLTAAALLAKKGRTVIIVERREIVGGLAAGHEFHPGYWSTGVLHDTTGVRRWVVEGLALEEHGLAFHPAPPPVFVPERDGSGLLLWRDPDAAAEELSRHSAQDGDRYREYRAFLHRITPVMRRLLDRPPPEIFEPRFGDLLDLGRSALALRMLGKRDMMEVLRIVPMCVADYLGEWFDTELVKAALAGPAIYSTWTGPWSPGSNLNLLLDESQSAGPVKGGPQALVAALERAAKALGVEIRTGTEVESLELRDGKVTGVRIRGGDVYEATRVVASCDPKHLFLQLLPPGSSPRQSERNIVNYRTRGTTAKVNLALSGYPKLACRPDLTPTVIRTGETIDELEQAFDPVKYKQLSEEPVLDIHVPTIESPELAPAGHHVFSILVSFTPYDLEGGWNSERKAELYQRVVARLARYAPDLEPAIVGSEVLSPADLESSYGLSGGHLHHGEHSTDQLLVRPTPECARYRTPFEGLFLCGSGSHPGGGITCAPGALAARTMLRS